jgi:hypothetical protein
MDKNPFSFYDFLGYLFPGLISILLIIYAVNTNLLDSVGAFFYATHFFKIFNGYIKMDIIEFAIIIILLSYVMGHIIAYLSSTTVEYFINRLVGYPSTYLLRDAESKDLKYKNLWGNYLQGNYSIKFWKIAVGVLLMPISLPLIVLGERFNILQFIIRPLDGYIRSSIVNKIGVLSQKLKLKVPDVTFDADYHRIIMHYVYLNVPNCQRKADNYVAIYGFLRALTFIACTFFIYIIVREIYTVIAYLVGDSKNISFDVSSIWVFCLMTFLCNILFMGFVKFYRRFTLENFMALLTDPTLNE